MKGNNSKYKYLCIFPTYCAYPRTFKEHDFSENGLIN